MPLSCNALIDPDRRFSVSDGADHARDPGGEPRIPRNSAGYFADALVACVGNVEIAPCICGDPSGA